MPEAAISPEVGREPTLFDVFGWIARHWWRLALCAVVGGGSTYAVVRTLPPQYTATVTVAPGSQTAGGLSGTALGGLSSLAGIPMSSGIDQVDFAIAMLGSRAFLDQYIRERGLTDKLLEEDTAGRLLSAADRERAFKRLQGMVEVKRGVGADRLVRVQVTWTDPREAAFWANDLVSRVNSDMKRRAIASAQSRKQYLEVELARSQNAELRASIAEMIGAELKGIMTARQPDGFAFDVLDPAVVPTKPSGPRIVVISAIGAILGFLCGLVWAGVSGLRRPT